MILTNPTPIILLAHCNMCFLAKHGLLLSLFRLSSRTLYYVESFSRYHIQLPSIFRRANPPKHTLHPALPEV